MSLQVSERDLEDHFKAQYTVREDRAKATFGLVILLVNIYTASFTVQNSIATFLMNSQGLTAAEFALFRGVITILAAKFLLYKDGLNVTSGIEKEHITPIYLRSIIGTLASILTIYIVKILPLTLFFIIF